MTEPLDLLATLWTFVDETAEFDRGELRVGQRYPRLRGGQRDPLCALQRWLIWHRDGGRCRFCGSTARIEVDHVIPWSAGGSDESTNLRLLCHECNQDRSNYRFWERPRLVAVAHCCDDCMHTTTELYRHQVHLLYDHRCAVCAPTVSPRSGGKDRDPSRPVFCGHCLSISIATNDLRVL